MSNTIVDDDTVVNPRVEVTSYCPVCGFMRSLDCDPDNPGEQDSAFFEMQEEHGRTDCQSELELG